MSTHGDIDVHSMPTEIYDQIVDELGPRDLAVFARAATYTNAVAAEHLYKHVSIPRSTPASTVAALLKTLAEIPYLAHMVTSLELDWTNEDDPPTHSPTHPRELAHALSLALLNTTNLEVLSVSNALERSPDWQPPHVPIPATPMLPELPRLRDVHFYSTAWTTTISFSHVLSRLHTLENLTLFPTQRKGVAHAPVSMPYLHSLRMRCTEELRLILNTRSGRPSPNVRRLDLSSFENKQIRSVLPLQTFLPDLDQVNFVRQFPLATLRRGASVLAPGEEPWRAVRRLGIYHCVAVHTTVPPRLPRTLLETCALAFPEIETLDLYCACEDKEHTSFGKQVVHDIAMILLDAIIPQLHSLQLMTFSGHAWVRQQSPAGEAAHATDFKDVPLQPEHSAPEIPFHLL